MKLIDADKLIEKLSAGLDNPEELPVISIGTVMRMIDSEEEIHISQPEIIHCGECRFREIRGNNGYCDHITGEEIMVWKDEYCSWAERGTDG